MPLIARIGDIVGGQIITGRSSVLANNIPVSGIGDPIIPHGGGSHGSALLVSGSPNVFAENIPVSRIGDAGTCGHIVVTGQNNVFVNEG
jgi:uncharacterized Zn-binding protein involved in type VI secretion